MKTRVAFALLTMCFESPVLGEVAQTRDPSSTASEQQICEEIDKRDLNAIEEAGKARRMPCVASLRRVMQMKIDERLRDAAELSLAQLGQVRELQRYLCSSRNARIAESAGYLPEIGGWYAIRGLLYLLTPEWHAEASKYVAERDRKNPEGVAYTQEYSILGALIHVVPHPPESLRIRVLPGDDDLGRPFARATAFYRERDRLVREWPEWISAHTAELRNLEPTGEGVDFSKGACDMKNGTPRRRER